MLGEADTFVFFLAEHLHKSLAEVRSWPSRDVEDWRAFFLAKPALEVMAGSG